MICMILGSCVIFARYGVFQLDSPRNNIKKKTSDNRQQAVRLLQEALHRLHRDHDSDSFLQHKIVHREEDRK